jgi:hypothetical protein
MKTVKNAQYLLLHIKTLENLKCSFLSPGKQTKSLIDTNKRHSVHSTVVYSTVVHSTVVHSAVV